MYTTMTSSSLRKTTKEQVDSSVWWERHPMTRYSENLLAIYITKEALNDYRMVILKTG
jgi:hypothetical protein